MPMIHIDVQVDSDAQAPITGVARNLLFLLEVVRNPLLLLTIAGVAGGGFWVLKQTNALNTAQAATRAEMVTQQQDSTKFAKQMAEDNNLKSQQSRYETLVARIRGVDDNRYAFLHVLDEAARALPTDTWLKSITTNSQDTMSRNVTVTIAGYAPNEAAVTDYVQRLNESPWITNGSIVKIDKSPVNRQILSEFVLVVDSEIPDQAWIQRDPISSVFGVKTPILIHKDSAAGQSPTPPPQP
jgi:Tfp pilus assembly protein PilN